MLLQRTNYYESMCANLLGFNSIDFLGRLKDNGFKLTAKRKLIP